MSNEPVAKRTRKGGKFVEIPTVELQIAFLLEDYFDSDKEALKQAIKLLNENLNNQNLKYRAMLDLVVNYDVSALVDVVEQL
jgi:hypothetical protein